MKTKEFVASIIEAARAYTRRGFYVVPIPRGKNHPTLKGWQKIRLRMEEVQKTFSDAWGVGLLLKPSKLTDVDLDCPEAVAAADVLLPPTAMVEGQRVSDEVVASNHELQDFEIRMLLLAALRHRPLKDLVNLTARELVPILMKDIDEGASGSGAGDVGDSN
jgi:Bifunctional DNA primase/polymerase, N-terminal